MPRRRGLQPANLDRERQMVELRLAGLTLEEIGRQMGVTKQRVGQVVDRALKRAIIENAEERKLFDLARTDRLIRAVYPAAVNPANPQHATAVRSFVSLMTMRAKWLGHDAPIKVEATIESAEARADRLGAELESWQEAQRQIDVTSVEVHKNGHEVKPTIT